MICAQQLSQKQIAKFFKYDIEDFIIKEDFDEDAFVKLMMALCKELPSGQAVERQLRNLVRREKPWAVVYIC